jgi:hypothetical protein
MRQDVDKINVDKINRKGAGRQPLRPARGWKNVPEEQQKERKGQFADSRLPWPSAAGGENFQEEQGDADGSGQRRENLFCRFRRETLEIGADGKIEDAGRRIAEREERAERFVRNEIDGEVECEGGAQPEELQRFDAFFEDEGRRRKETMFLIFWLVSSDIFMFSRFSVTPTL